MTMNIHGRCYLLPTTHITPLSDPEAGYVFWTNVMPTCVLTCCCRLTNARCTVHGLQSNRKTPCRISHDDYKNRLDLPFSTGKLLERTVHCLFGQCYRSNFHQSSFTAADWYVYTKVGCERENMQIHEICNKCCDFNPEDTAEEKLKQVLTEKLGNDCETTCACFESHSTSLV